MNRPGVGGLSSSSRCSSISAQAEQSGGSSCTHSQPPGQATASVQPHAMQLFTFTSTNAESPGAIISQRMLVLTCTSLRRKLPAALVAVHVGGRPAELCLVAGADELDQSLR